TAAALAEDLGRFLADQPIRARRTSAAGRVARWGKRKPVVAGLLMGVFLSFLGGTAVASYFGWAASPAAGAAGQSAAGEAAKAKEAKDNEQRAKDNAAKADEEKRRAEQEEKIAKRRYYAATMNLAMRALENNQPARVLELLETQRPRPGEEDLR